MKYCPYCGAALPDSAVSFCPECGKSYVSGGTTSTQIKYPSDPYTKSQKALLDENAKGNNIDYAA